MKSLEEKIDIFLTERRKTTRVEMVRAERELKIDKTKDTGPELYVDMVKFLATYLNSLNVKDMVQYKVMNREKAEQLISAMVSAHPNAQAVLTKLNLDAKQFVSRYWTKMDMKYAIQDAINLLIRGEKGVAIAAPSKDGTISGRFDARESKEEPVEEKKK